jgi:gamma-glutamyltranspeptidase/glutathione hydrolase
MEMFRDGGNAVDAAVCGTFAMFVALPQACGLGGDAMVLIDSPDGACAFNGVGPAPLEFTARPQLRGAEAVSVPGALYALEAVHRSHGSVPWKRLVEIAAAHADASTVPSPVLLRAIRRRREALEKFAPEWLDCVERSPGAPAYTQPALAATLRKVALVGTNALGASGVAAAMVAASRRAGGFLSAQDFASPAVSAGKPVASRLFGSTVMLQPPPSQALLAAITLRALETAPPDEYARAVTSVESIDAAFRFRDEIARPGAATSFGTALDLTRPCSGTETQAADGTHTAALAAADATGVIVGVVASLFDDFGSGVFVPDCGFFLNNRLHGFSTDKQSPNCAAAGRPPVSTLAPAIVQGPTARWAIATPGADGQVQFLIQVIDAVVTGGKTIAEAIRAPRWRSVFGRVAVEAAFSAVAEAALSAAGHDVYRRANNDGFFGDVVAAGICSEGQIFAVADTREDSVARGE